MLRKLDEISIYIFDHIWMLIINACPQRDTKLIEYNIILSHVRLQLGYIHAAYIRVYYIPTAGTFFAYSLKNVCV